MKNIEGRIFALTHELNKIVKNAIEENDINAIDLIAENIGEVTGRINEVNHFCEFECREPIDKEDYFSMLYSAFNSLWYCWGNEKPLVFGDYDLGKFKKGA